MSADSRSFVDSNIWLYAFVAGDPSKAAAAATVAMEAKEGRKLVSETCFLWLCYLRIPQLTNSVGPANKRQSCLSAVPYPIPQWTRRVHRENSPTATYSDASSHIPQPLRQIGHWRFSRHQNPIANFMDTSLFRL